MTYWGDHMGTGGWIFSIIATLIILAIIVGLIVWVVSPSSRSGSAATAGESGHEILDRRLASGEINIEQYRQLRQELDASPSAPPSGRPPRAAGAPG